MVLFLRYQILTHSLKKSKKKEPLGIYSNASDIISLDHEMSPHIAKFSLGRASFKSSPIIKGSMTVEASLVVPIFIIAIMTLYLFFSILCEQSILVMEQREKGKKICVYANTYESITGIGDIVFLTDSRKVDQKIPSFLTSEISVNATFYAHAWTGYEISGDGDSVDEEEYVYITPNGTVYHRDIGCTHLKLSIQTVDFSYVSSLRNEDGGCYSKCDYCGSKTPNNGVVYITNYGDCYHTSLSCPGIKRTIETIPISKVGNRKACSKCGG